MSVEKTTSSETSVAQESVHRGYDPEKGWLHRIRHWDDVFPSIRLARVLRGVVSPVLLLIILVTMVLDHQVCRWTNAQMSSDVSWKDSIVGVFESLTPPLKSLSAKMDESITPGDSFTPGESFTPDDSSATVRSWQSWANILLRILLWTVPMMVLTRQGARLTAGRTMDPTMPTMRLAARRWWGGLVVVAMPMLCCLVFAFGMIILGKIATWLPMAPWLDRMIAGAVVVVSIPGSILLAGSITAVPLGLAALVNEPEADPLDSLSRGYESTFRGWLALVGSGSVATVLLALIFVPAWTLSAVASQFCETALILAGADRIVAPVNEWLLMIVPTVLMTATGLLIGGVYLLMRRRVNGQEVEDLWDASPGTSPDLPELKTSTSG